MFSCFSGKSKDAVKGPADQLKAANITVFAIGVGRKYDIAQLIDIASKPDRKYALTADFNNLNDLYSSIRDDACRGILNVIAFKGVMSSYFSYFQFKNVKRVLTSNELQK